MAYASITYTSASGTTFALTNSSGDPIEYLRQNDISVTVNGVLKTLTTDYTFNTAGTAIVLNTAVSGATVVIARTTDIADATVSFTAGSTLTAQDLNNSDKQNRFALQEFSDTYGALTTGTGDLSALDGFIGSAETWVSDNAHAPTTGAVDSRVDSKIDTALTTDVVAGDSITVTDNSPSSGQITIGVTNASISTAKLVDSSVTTAKIADGNVTTAKILDANVTTAKILDANVTTVKIADNAVTSAKIADGTIVAADLASDSVTTAKILDSNVTTGKINDLAVTTAKLADSSVTSAKIVDGTIVAGDLASDSVTTAKIVDSNVTTAKINDSAVTTGKIADSAVTAIKIADGVITSAKLNAATVVTAAEQAACTPDDVTFFTTSASDGRYVNVTGDSMTGALAMGSNKITGLGAPTANADAATKQYVDTSVAAGVGDADYGDITVSGTGTVWTIDSGVVTSAKIADGTIVDGDINASAAIALSKLATGALPTAITVASANIVDGTIVNADVNAAAAIAGTKISPDFGSQNVTTTGTVTGASLSPTSSTAPTNGVYLPAANSVAISTGGSGRLFINSSGQVGVGTSSQSDSQSFGNAFEIRGSTGSAVYSATSDNATRAYFATYTGGGYLGTETNHPLIIRTNNTEKVRITSAGLVGIGTSNVNAPLEVNKAASGLTEIVRLGGTASATNDGWKLSFYQSSVGEKGYIGSFYDGSAWQTVTNGDIQTIRTGGTERVRVDSSGRVGIGNTDPGTLLAVGGSSANGSIFLRSGSNNVVQIYSVSPGGAYSEIDSQTEMLLRTEAGAMRFSTVNTERARIDSSGRLLVGTSSASAAATSVLVQGNGSSSTAEGIIRLTRGTTTPGASDELGTIAFGDSNHNTAAYLACNRDGGTWNTSTSRPTRLVFSTTSDAASSPTERARITSGGFFKASNTGSYPYGGNRHELVSNVSDFAAQFTNSNATPAGLILKYSGGSPNNTGSEFLYCEDSGSTQRASIMSNGGLRNYSANNANLSDRNAKKDISPAAGTWDCIKEWEIVNYRYKDQPDDADLNMGVIAQQVAESCPEVITVFQEAKEATEDQPAQEERLGVKEQQMYWMAIKALQEAQVRIEVLEAEVAALKAQ